jgi:hypothetical protein
MKYALAILCLMSTAFAGEVHNPSLSTESSASDQGIDFKDWEKDFDKSVRKNKHSYKKKCEIKSRNCEFEKMQGLDPASGIIH